VTPLRLSVTNSWSFPYPVCFPAAMYSCPHIAEMRLLALNIHMRSAAFIWAPRCLSSIRGGFARLFGLRFPGHASARSTSLPAGLRTHSASHVLLQPGTRPLHRISHICSCRRRIRADPIPYQFEDLRPANRDGTPRGDIAFQIGAIAGCRSPGPLEGSRID